MKKYSITIIGSGSAYTPGIVNSILANMKRLPIKRITLLDNEEDRLHKIGDYVEVLIKEKFPDVEIVLTTDRKTAFTGMDFLFAQIRAGRLPQRSLDEKIPLKYNVPGQETCGPGGFAFAMREIPQMVSISKDVVKYAPDAWIINYSNPTAIVAAAVHKAVPEAKNLCICDMPVAEEQILAANLDKKAEDLTFDYFGLNHLGWFTSIYNNEGKDLLPQLAEKLRKDGLDIPDAGFIDDDWRKTFNRIPKGVKYFPQGGYIPLTYLQYYLYPDEIVKDEDPKYTRADMVIENREKKVYAQCDDVVKKGTVKGCSLSEDTHGDFIVDVATAIANNTGERYIINVPNRGAIENFDYDSIVELPCYVDIHGAHPVSIGKIPLFQKGLMEAVNAYERLTVEAALEGSYEKALMALTLNPIVPSVGIAKKILDDYIEVNKKYFPELK